MEIYVALGIVTAPVPTPTNLSDSTGDDITPDWAPTGATIAFASSWKQRQFDIYKMGAANGNSQQRITNSPGLDGQPHFVAPLSVIFVSARTTGEGPGLCTR